MERLYNMDETPVEETTANEEKHLKSSVLCRG
jgi:hypothetical protein